MELIRSPPELPGPPFGFRPGSLARKWIELMATSWPQSSTVDDKWAVLILLLLRGKALLRSLRRTIGGISRKMPSQVLKSPRDSRLRETEKA